MSAAERKSVPFTRRVRGLIDAIQNGENAEIEAAILRLSRRRRVFAPLALAIGAFVLLFDGVRLLLSNWRLTVIQILPAMWIWLAMFDLKLHVLHGKSFNIVRGPILIPIFVVIIAITIGSFFCNAIFAFAIAEPGRPEIRPGVAKARQHFGTIALSGGLLGLALAFATTVVSRHPRPWFALTLGTVCGLMMLAYVAVPARLIGGKPQRSRRDRMWSAALGGALSFMVTAPPYVLGRIGILMLGSKTLLVPGIILVAIGVTLQSGATGAVRAIKMSATLTPPASGSSRTAPDAKRSAGGAGAPAAGPGAQVDEEGEHDEEPVDPGHVVSRSPIPEGGVGERRPR
jgi:hypothetical protein